MTKAEKLFKQALTHVESDSIRAWANSADNRPIWIKIAAKAGHADPVRFAAFIVATAMG